MVMNHDIIIAPATLPGSGAITVIRVSGEGCLELADDIVSLHKGCVSECKGYTLHYGNIKDDRGLLIDDVMVGVFRAPKSYTGEDALEISCHASRFIAQQIIRAFTEHGARLALRGEFTRRAYLNGKIDLAQAEAVADVIAADSQAAHDMAINQLKGNYSKSFKELRDALVEASALVELELDFSDEHEVFADRGRLSTLVDSALSRIGRLKDTYRMGNALKNGVPVAIVGAPNAGKSTLLNALIGEDRAIVSDIPGTTRDTVEECMVINGVQYRFIDTAGIRETDETIERLGIERSIDNARKAAVVIGLLDADKPDESIDFEARLKGMINSDRQKLLLVCNKSDIVAEGSERMPYLHISALNGSGLSELKQAIADLGFGSNASSDTIVTSERHYNALCQSYNSLERVKEAINAGISEELLAQDLRAAISDLTSIFASVSDTITPDEVLGEIFSRFCIGK